MVNDTPSDELVKRLRGMSKQLRASAKHSPLTSDFGWHEWPGEAADRIRELEAYALKQLDDINRLTTELVKAKAANRRKP